MSSAASIWLATALAHTKPYSLACRHGTTSANCYSLFQLLMEQSYKRSSLQCHCKLLLVPHLGLHTNSSHEKFTGHLKRPAVKLKQYTTHLVGRQALHLARQ